VSLPISSKRLDWPIRVAVPQAVPSRKVDRTFVTLGSFLAFVAVGLGAFGTHTLRPRISERSLEIWNTGVQYHMVHAVALVMVGLMAAHCSSRLIRAAGWLFVVGIAIFGGTLYVLAGTGIGWLGAITPLGGLSFLAGWVCLAVGSRSAR
jgi:uncharacterized membrane protein YgdD (TMEM256/DUF423 family)